MQIAVLMFFENVTKKHRCVIQKQYVQQGEVGNPSPGSRSLALMYTVIMGNPGNYHKTVITLLRGSMFLNMIV